MAATPATVLTHGLGSYSTVNLLLTLGFGGAAEAAAVAAFTFFARGRTSSFRAQPRQSDFAARRRQTTFHAIERD